LLRGEGPLAVTARYYGDRVYPAHIDEYYLDWRPLFSNAYVHVSPQEIWRKFPPLRYWYGPKYYYFGEDLHLWAEAGNSMYFLFIVVLPIILAFILSAFIFTLAKIKTRSRSNHIKHLRTHFK